MLRYCYLIVICCLYWSIELHLLYCFSQVNASLYALEGGTSVVIANGQFKEINTVNDIVNGQKIGTFFTYAEKDIVPIEDQAIKGF